MTPDEALETIGKIESLLRELRVYAQGEIQYAKTSAKPKPSTDKKKIRAKTYIHRMAVHALLNRGFINVDFGLVGRWLKSFGYGTILEAAREYGDRFTEYDLSDQDKLRYFVGGLKRMKAEKDSSGMVVFALKSLHEITDYKDQDKSADTVITYVPEDGKAADKLRAFWSGDE